MAPPLFRALGLAAALAVAGLSAPAVAQAQAPSPTPPAAAGTVAEVSPAAAQTIDDIGASGAWWVNDLANFSPSVQNRVAALLFGPSGAQLSAYRYNIGGGGTGVTDPVRAPQTFLTADGSYDWTKDPGGQRFLQLAARYKVKDLIGFVNSAPASMTTNGQSCAGQLTAGQEGAYGEYLATVVDHFRSQGIGLDYVSPMNEPDSSFSGCGQEGMQVPVSQRGAIVRAVGAALAAHGDGTGVIADESSQVGQFNSEVPTWTAEAGTLPYVSALAHHTYDNPSTGAMEQAAAVAAKAGKKSWATEICCFGAGGGWSQGYDPGIDGGLALSGIVYQDFTVTHDSAFQWWTALSPMLGCDPTASSGCATTANSEGWNDGLIYYDPAYATDGNQSLYPTKRFWALAQYSRFVRPGAVVHDVTGAPDGVQVSAYRQGHTWTLVVNNRNTTATSLTVSTNAGTALAANLAVRTSATEDMAPIAPARMHGDVVDAELAPRSVTTYTFTEEGAPQATAVSSEWLSRSAGKCLDVPGAALSAGAAVDISACTGGTNQSWTQHADATLRVDDSLCLAPAAGGSTAGTRAAVATCDGSTAQQWRTNGDGTITNQANGLCLDVNGQGTTDGTAAILWTCNGGSNQHWFRPPTAGTGTTGIVSNTAWSDSDGRILQAHGSGVFQVGDTYYLVGEDRAAGSGFYGIACYSSTDLVHWTHEGEALSRQSSGDLAQNRVVERPKVIHNDTTGQYVMYVHIDSPNYGEAKVGVATSSTPCGAYAYRGSFQPLGQQSRDLGLFKDTDGTGYLLSEDRKNGLRIDRLSADYLTVDSSVAVLADMEAPAMFKQNGVYYLLGSHLTGWNANDNAYTTATSLSGPWSAWQTFAPAGTSTYRSQTAAVIPVTGSAGTTFVYVGDRWNPTDLFHSTPIWLPLTVDGLNVSTQWYDSWTVDTGTGLWSRQIHDTRYQAESGTLAGGAVVQSCSACSGGSKVGYLGGGSGTLTLDQVTVAKDGDYTVKIWYANGDSSDRYADLSADGGTAVRVAFPSTGSATTVKEAVATVHLQAGTNTLSFGNATGWAPDLDVVAVPQAG